MPWREEWISDFSVDLPAHIKIRCRQTLRDSLRILRQHRTRIPHGYLLFRLSYFSEESHSARMLLTTQFLSTLLPAFMIEE